MVRVRTVPVPFKIVDEDGRKRREPRGLFNNHDNGHSPEDEEGVDQLGDCCCEQHLAQVAAQPFEPEDVALAEVKPAPRRFSVLHPDWMQDVFAGDRPLAEFLKLAPLPVLLR